MRYLPPQLRLRIDADLAGGSPLCVLGLEGLSIVAALRELSWQLTVTFSQSFLDESEYAARLVEVLCHMATTARLLPPRANWSSNATLRLRTETRKIDDSDETESVVLLEFSAHELELSHDKLYSLTPRVRAKLMEAYKEEGAIIRSLHGFAGDSGALLERLRICMECGAILAKAQLFDNTAHRAQMGLHCLYTADPAVRKRVDKFTTWLIRLQDDEEQREELLTSLSDATPYPRRMH